MFGFGVTFIDPKHRDLLVADAPGVHKMSKHVWMNDTLCHGLLHVEPRLITTVTMERGLLWPIAYNEN